MADITPKSKNNNKGNKKRVQDQRPGKTSLPKQKTTSEGSCCELCSTGPTMEQVTDAIGGPSQRDQQQVFVCFGNILSGETAASASNLLTALKNVLPTCLSQDLHVEQQQQEVGCRHTPVTAISPNTQHGNHILALGLHQTVPQSEACYTSVAAETPKHGLRSPAEK